MVWTREKEKITRADATIALNESTGGKAERKTTVTIDGHRQR